MAPYAVGQLERDQVGAAERHAGVGRQRAVDAAAAREVDDPLRAHQVEGLDRGDVDRELERAAQGEDADVAPVVVLRRVAELGVGAGEEHGTVEERVGGGEPLLQRGAVDHGLESRADLPVGLRGAVELAALEAPAADHRAHRARGVVQDERDALDSRLLLEHQPPWTAAFRLLEAEPCDVAALQQIGDALLARPADAVALEGVALGADAHLGAVGRGGEDDPLVPLAGRVRAGLPGGQLLLLEVMVEVHRRAAPAAAMVEAHEVAAERVLRGPLHGRVEGGLHAQAGAVQPLRPVALLEVAPHLLGEVSACLLLLAAGRGHEQRLGDRLAVRLLVDEARLPHALQHVVAAPHHLLGIADGIEVVGALRDAGEGRGLDQLEAGGRLVEEVPGCGLHAVVALAHVDEVAVQREDVLLAVALLDLDGEEGLGDLPPPAPPAGVEEVLRHLHGERGRALRDAARANVLHDGAQHAVEVHAAVLEEPLVLDGHDRLAQQRRHLPLGQHDAPLEGVGGVSPAGAVVQLGDQARREVVELVHLGHVDHRRGEHPAAQPDAEGVDPRPPPEMSRHRARSLRPGRPGRAAQRHGALARRARRVGSRLRLGERLVLHRRRL